MSVWTMCPGAWFFAMVQDLAFASRAAQMEPRLASSLPANLSWRKAVVAPRIKLSTSEELGRETDHSEARLGRAFRETPFGRQAAVIIFHSGELEPHERIGSSGRHSPI